MQVRAAVEIAKGYVLDLFGEDGLAGLRLEEVELGADGVWNVTVGFTRPLVLTGGLADTLAGLGGPMGPRTYRLVRVRDDDGGVLSVKIREGLN